MEEEAREVAHAMGHPSGPRNLGEKGREEEERDTAHARPTISNISLVLLLISYMYVHVLARLFTVLFGLCIPEKAWLHELRIHVGSLQTVLGPR